jgi:hypothetical protein
MDEDEEILTEAQELAHEGEEFDKKELYQYAYTAYQEALELEPDHPDWVLKMKESRRNYRRDAVKVVISVCVVLAIVVLVYYLLR